MSVTRLRFRARAQILVAALALGLASTAIPAPVEAGALPDLVVLAGSTNITVHAGGTFAHVYWVNNVGGGPAAAGVVSTFTLPAGFEVRAISYSSPNLWVCAHKKPTTAACTNQAIMPPGQYPTRIRVDVRAPTTPGSYVGVSKVNPDDEVAESNEENNQLATTINVVP
jgi:hypothetical protein